MFVKQGSNATNIINTDVHPASEVGADNTVTFPAPARTQFLEADGIRFAYRIPVVPEEQWRNLEEIIVNYSAGDSSWFARLKEISHPTLIMNGDRDPCYPLQNQLLLHCEIPDSRLAILPMAGHDPQHQFPQECATMIDDFLSA